ncbi:MAG: tRNA (adenosine(37)-N6)-threonylcarbamoyltransferase complex dimerization subunit type 1 TsaB [Synechocystis sp.]|nr:tRNA (adenosine(37)-N6)-threonylcarbamoyltransferase complex dimerization subunit type 1 TsaB [Synechocystis sp.]
MVIFPSYGGHPAPPAQLAYGLAIHSSTGELGLAIAAGKTVERSQTWLLKRELLNQIQICLGEFLAPQGWTDLTYVAVAQGPGSFSSIRIGMVAARILAQQLGIPLFAISSLQGFAQLLLPTAPPGIPLAVTMKATRGYLYGAIYQEHQGQLIPISGDRLWLPSEWDALLQSQNLTAIAAPEELGHTAPALLTIAAHRWQAGERPHWSAAEPFYGMSPTDPL